MADEKGTDDLEASVRALLAAKIAYDTEVDAAEASVALARAAAERVTRADAAVKAAQFEMEKRLYRSSVEARAAVRVEAEVAAAVVRVEG